MTIKLTYREAYSNPIYNKYSKYYSDFVGKPLNKNSSVVFINNNNFNLGSIELKDYEIENGVILKDLPHIKSFKEVIPCNGKNCILI